MITRTDPTPATSWLVCARVCVLEEMLDAPRTVGATFVVEPTEASRAYGRKARCTVVKVTPSP